MELSGVSFVCSQSGGRLWKVIEGTALENGVWPISPLSWYHSDRLRTANRMAPKLFLSDEIWASCATLLATMHIVLATTFVLLKFIVWGVLGRFWRLCVLEESEIAGVWYHSSHVTFARRMRPYSTRFISPILWILFHAFSTFCEVYAIGLYGGETLNESDVG